MSKLVILAGLYLVLAFFPAQPAIAQNSIDIVENRASQHFPETIEFKLAANSPANIERVTLNYGTNARGCQSGGARQSVQFDPDTEVAVEWEWDLKRSGSLPPGAQVWWEWIINDVDGHELTTERQELLVTDGRHKWRSLNQENVTIYWFEGNDDFAQTTLKNTFAYLDQSSEQIGVQLSGDIELWIYPTAADVRDAMALSQDWAGAVAFSDYDIMLVSLAPGQNEWAAEVLPHELTHLIVGTATENCRGGYLPVWLNEGLATYAEGDASSNSLEDLAKALQEERLPSLQSLADGFSAYGGSASLAYAQSGAVVRFLVETFGREKMNELMIAIRDGLPIDQALEQIYDFDTNELDACWRLIQGYAPTPTSEAANALAKATPTPVPTIPLGGLSASATSTATLAPATDTPAPASPNPTKTSPPATETATAEVLAILTSATPDVDSIETLDKTNADTLPTLPILLLGVGIFVLGVGLILFFLKRKGK